MFDAQETLQQSLECHRGKLDSMSSELLRAFTCEFNAHAQDYSSSIQLSNHSLNSATHFSPDITTEATCLRNVSTKIRHERHQQ